MTGARAILVWAALALALAVPIGVAATSPLLAWREPVYIAAGLAGVAGLGLLLVQPLLAQGRLPGLTLRRARRMHAWTGGLLVAAVAVHVVGLALTSPPDVIDALLLRSPTAFSVWGVAAMWAVLAAAAIAALRRRWGFGLRLWRLVHTTLAAAIVVGTVVHAMLIDGTMGPVSKTGLCLLVLAAAAWAIVEARPRIPAPGAGLGLRR